MDQERTEEQEEQQDAAERINGLGFSVQTFKLSECAEWKRPALQAIVADCDMFGTDVPPMQEIEEYLENILQAIYTHDTVSMWLKARGLA